jgi:transmembrane sensor
MEPKLRSKLNTQIYEEASVWFVESRAGDLDDAGRREFDRWLRRSPEHLSAYLEIAALWSEGGHLDPTHKWDADTLIAQAAKDPGNVVALSEVTREGLERISALASCEDRPAVSEAESTHSVRRILGIRRTHLFGLAASVATLAVAAGAWLWFALPSSVYTTAIGEQRSLVFADGSTVEMNSKSKIQVRYSRRERAVDLLEGQALFHVAKDHARPFIVSAQGTWVRAVGTQFDVYERRSGTVVTVLEGQVAVLTPAATGNSGTAEPPTSLATPAEVGSQAVLAKSAGRAVRRLQTSLHEGPEA